MREFTFVERLRCPHCVKCKEGRLSLARNSWLVCEETGCGRKYPIRDGLPVMLLEEGEKWVAIDVADLPRTIVTSKPRVPEPSWLEWKANEQRIAILQMVMRAGNGHIGGAYSIIDVITAIYFRMLRYDPSFPDWPERDRFILSKGHSCLALYVTLADVGYFPRAKLHEFCQDGGLLGVHPERGHIPGVEVTTGSLGHGLSLAVGMALAAKMDKATFRIFVVLSDGECNEGSVWEALMSAAQLKLGRLTIIIDDNKLISLGPTSDIMKIEPIAERLRTFGWAVREIDGHNMSEIVSSLEGVPFESEKPSAIVAHTVKGKGVSFMENVPMWHLRRPSNDEAQAAFRELAASLRI